MASVNQVFTTLYIIAFLPIAATETAVSQSHEPWQTTEEPFEESDNMHVAYLASAIEKACYHASDIRKDMNRYAYTCFLEKPRLQYSEIVDHFELCCKMKTTCTNPSEDSSEKECTDRFCGCLDMINIVHEPRIKECMSSKLPACKETTSVWGHDASWLEDDIGFMKVFNRNVILGRGGIAAFSIALIISTASFTFLVYVCVSYRCCRRKQKSAEPVPAVEPDVATAYALTDPPANAADIGDTTAQTPPANTTNSVASTTRSSAVVPKASNTPNDSHDNTITKELIEWP